MIALPPLLAGAVHNTVTSPSPTVADKPSGLPGAAAGVAVTGSDAGPSSTSLVATTLKVYGVPLTRSSTMHDNGSGSVETVVQTNSDMSRSEGKAVTV